MTSKLSLGEKLFPFHAFPDSEGKRIIRYRRNDPNISRSHLKRPDESVEALSVSKPQPTQRFSHRLRSLTDDGRIFLHFHITTQNPNHVPSGPSVRLTAHLMEVHDLKRPQRCCEELGPSLALGP